MRTIRRRRIAVFTFPQRRERGIVDKLIVGIDFDAPRAHNIMGYVRSARYDNEEQAEAYPEFWLSLEHMDKLGVLLILFARFWAKTRRKG
jgi:hypothetical protein